MAVAQAVTSSLRHVSRALHYNGSTHCCHSQVPLPPMLASSTFPPIYRLVSNYANRHFDNPSKEFTEWKFYTLLNTKLNLGKFTVEMIMNTAMLIFWSDDSFIVLITVITFNDLHNQYFLHNYFKLKFYLK